MPKPKLTQIDRTQFTAEAFRELAEAAILELYEHSDVYEVHQLTAWTRRLKRAIADVANHEASGDDEGIDIE